MKKVECKGCGWSWDLKDGGSDPYKCHKCGQDNTDHYKLKIKVNKEDQEYINESIKNGDVIVEDLGRWFKEKWVDVSRKIDGKHPPCGRTSSDGEKGRKGYPKCRPSKKVSKETPKTSSSYSKKEKKSMTDQKRNAEKKDPKTGKGNKPTITKFDENELLRLTKLVVEQLKENNLFYIPKDEQESKTPHKYNVGDEITYISHDYSEIDAVIIKQSKNYINNQGYNTYVVKTNNDNTTIVDEKDIIDTYGSVEETDYIPDDSLNEAEYQGRKVELNKIMKGDVKKFKVYTKNDKGNVVKVNFGFGGKSAKGKRMHIKKNNPERRKSFRARHNCDNPGPKWKARYWACRTW
jgi:hypothetical protein